MPEIASRPDFRTLATPPLSVNNRLFDRFVRRAHQVERVKAGLARDTSRFLRDSVFSRLADTLSSRLSRIRGRRDVARIHGTAAFQSLAKTTREALTAGYGRAMNDLAKQLRNLAIEESRFVVRVLGQDMPFDYSAKVPALREFRRVVRQQPFSGKTLGQWFGGLSNTATTNTMSQINLGLLEGETTEKIVRRITGRKGVFDRALGEAEKIADTAAGHASNGGGDLAVQANAEVVGWEVWTAILDSATCVICAGLDGNRYKVGEGPIPGESTHPGGCRCKRIPALKSAKELGLKEGDLTPLERRAMDGKVPEKTTYAQWLRRQPVDVQNEVLGPSRARMWRGNRITIDRMVDARLRPLTLEELEQKI
jgi:hypothetical protein